LNGCSDYLRLSPMPNDASTLLHFLETVPVRERGGATASNRFDYQKNWALCHLLELHERGDDYTLVMEHHEDVLVLDSAHSPTKLEFFQVKTRRDGVWTRNNLLTRGRGIHGRSSILGRLYGNRLRFEAATGSLNLVSNTAFDLRLSTGRSRSAVLVRASDLHHEEAESIASRLATEHEVDDARDFAALTHFHVCPLPIDQHATFAIGRLGEYLERRFPDRPHPTTALHRTLFDLVTRMQDVEHTPPTIGELLRKKAVTRRQLEDFLAPVGQDTDIARSWQTASQQLVNEGMLLPQLHRITSQRTTYEVQRMDRTNRVIQALREATGGAIGRLLPAGPVQTRVLITSVADEVLRSDRPQFGVLSHDLIMAAALFEYITYEESTGSVSALDSQSEAENA